MPQSILLLIFVCFMASGISHVIETGTKSLTDSVTKTEQALKKYDK